MNDTDEPINCLTNKFAQLSTLCFTDKRDGRVVDDAGDEEGDSDVAGDQVRLDGASLATDCSDQPNSCNEKIGQLNFRFGFWKTDFEWLC